MLINYFTNMLTNNLKKYENKINDKEHYINQSSKKWNDNLNKYSVGTKNDKLKKYENRNEQFKSKNISESTVL